MVKNIPLVRRLDEVLLITSNIVERDEVFGLAGRYIKIKSGNKGVFYGHLKPQTLDYNLNKKDISLEDIKFGKKIYEILKTSINLPSASLSLTDPKNYRTKLEGAINFEYKLIIEALRNEK